MMRRICKYCGAQYSGDPGSSCCPDCAAAQRETTLRPRACRNCGATFDGGPRAWYCPTCRAERRREADRRAKRQGTARPLGSTDLCEICGRPYLVAGGRQRYCPDCAPAAVAAVDRAQSRSWNADNTTTETRRAEKTAAVAPVPCTVCGTLFLPLHGRTTCSETCRREARRRKAVEYEAAHREERAAYHRQLRAARLAAMTPEEQAQARADTNAKARDYYRRRKDGE